MWLLILIGIVGIVLSATLSKQRFNKSRLPPEVQEHTAGTGLVPSWVSLVNIVSWIILGIGVLSLFF
jgi:hypothetical protein